MRGRSCSISLGRVHVTCPGLTANVSRLLVSMNNAWSLITPAARPSGPGKVTLQLNIYPVFDSVILCRTEEMVFLEMMIDAEHEVFGLVTSDYICLGF